MNSTPFSSHTGTSSATSIGLEASEICVSPLQNASKPSLVPAPPTSMRASGFCSRNSSAAAWVIGCTVLEPSMLMFPETASPPSLHRCPPQAAITNVSARRRPTATGNLERAILLNPFAPFFAPLITGRPLTGHDNRASRPRRSFSSVNSTLNLC